jgi:Protein of unknown function (DUF1064)
VRLTEAEYQAVLDRRNIPAERKREIASLGGKARATKYGNHITHLEGIRFDSRKEASYYADLLLLKASGAIRGFARQVSIPLPSGKRRIRLDFVITDNDGRIRWVDVKGGKPTEAWSVRRDEVQAMLGITIEIA